MLSIHLTDRVFSAVWFPTRPPLTRRTMETSMAVDKDRNILTDLTIQDLMTTDVVTLADTENMNLASMIMRIGRIRHLPVVDGNNKLKGLVTHRDLLRVSVSDVADLSQKERRELLKAIPVREVMRSEVLSTHPDTPLLEAARHILAHKYGCLPVIDKQGHLIGLVTEADFVKMMVRLLEMETEREEAE